MISINNETEQQIKEAAEEQLKKYYLQGLKIGMKTACAVILETLENNKNLNPQKRVALIKSKIEDLLAPLDKDETKEENN